jgi:hypothetical protein
MVVATEYRVPPVYARAIGAAVEFRIAIVKRWLYLATGVVRINEVCAIQTDLNN